MLYERKDKVEDCIIKNINLQECKLWQKIYYYYISIDKNFYDII